MEKRGSTCWLKRGRLCLAWLEGTEKERRAQRLWRDQREHTHSLIRASPRLILDLAGHACIATRAYMIQSSNKSYKGCGIALKLSSGWKKNNNFNLGQSALLVLHSFYKCDPKQPI